MDPRARARTSSRRRGSGCRAGAGHTSQARVVTPQRLDAATPRGEPLRDPDPGPTIQDLIGLQPGSSGHCHAKFHERKTGWMMGVAIDGDQATNLAGTVSVGWV